MRTQLFLELIASQAYLALCAGAVLALLILLRVRASLRSRVAALQGAAWELVRLMENTTPDGPRERAKMAEATTEKFAVTGNASISRPSLVSGDETTSELTAAGLKLMERHANEAAQFRSFRSALRRGIAIFLSLMVHRNSQSAYTAMTEYMGRQIEKKDIPNFTELKMALGLPADWPSEYMMRRKYSSSRWNDFAMDHVARRGRRILDDLAYNPPTPDGKTPIVLTGESILIAMRAYLHTSNTYDQILAPPAVFGPDDM